MFVTKLNIPLLDSFKSIPHLHTLRSILIFFLLRICLPSCSWKQSRLTEGWSKWEIQYVT